MFFVAYRGRCFAVFAVPGFPWGHHQVSSIDDARQLIYGLDSDGFPACFPGFWSRSLGGRWQCVVGCRSWLGFAGAHRGAAGVCHPHGRRTRRAGCGGWAGDRGRASRDQGSHGRCCPAAVRHGLRGRRRQGGRRACGTRLEQVGWKGYWTVWEVGRRAGPEGVERLKDRFRPIGPGRARRVRPRWPGPWRGEAGRSGRGGKRVPRRRRHRIPGGAPVCRRSGLDTGEASLAAALDRTTGRAVAGPVDARRSVWGLTGSTIGI